MGSRPIEIYGDEVSSFVHTDFGIRVRSGPGSEAPRLIRDAFYLKSGGRKSAIGDAVLAEAGSTLLFDIGYRSRHGKPNVGFGFKLEVPLLDDGVLIDAVYFPARPGDAKDGWVYGSVDQDDLGHRILVDAAATLREVDDPKLRRKLRFWFWPIEQWEVDGTRHGETTRQVSPRASGNLGVIVTGDKSDPRPSLRHARIVAADDSSASDFTVTMLTGDADSVSAPVLPEPGASPPSEETR